MKRYSISLVIKEIEIKITMKYLYNPQEWFKFFKKNNNIKHW